MVHTPAVAESIDEYWNDALGRRVLRRSRQDSPICTDSNRCYSGIERYIWSGDQILWETRQAEPGNTKDPAPTTSSGQTGHVGYVHAGGIDTPIGMIRNDTTVVLHRNWRGLYAGATNHAGATVGSNVPWPAKALHGDLMAAEPRPNHVWVGSLPMAQQDHSGLVYMRNRYYDPETGQFTQPDPIGFGGGYNLYGYAAGDAVNNSDPFGLSPCPDVNDHYTCYSHPGIRVRLLNFYRREMPHGLAKLDQDQVSTICVVADACDPFGPREGLPEVATSRDSPFTARCVAAIGVAGVALVQDVVAAVPAIRVATIGMAAGTAVTTRMVGYVGTALSRTTFVSRTGGHGNLTAISRVMAGNLATHAWGGGTSIALGGTYGWASAIASYAPGVNFGMSVIQAFAAC